MVKRKRRVANEEAAQLASLVLAVLQALGIEADNPWFGGFGRSGKGQVKRLQDAYCNRSELVGLCGAIDSQLRELPLFSKKRDLCQDAVDAINMRLGQLGPPKIERPAKANRDTGGERYATPKQIAVLRRYGVESPEGYSVAEATALIGQIADNGWRQGDYVL